MGLWGLVFVSFLALSSSVAAQRGIITWDDLKLNDGHSASLGVGAADRSRLIVVSKDGRRDSLTVQGAIDLVPENNIQRVKIHIRPGVYREKVHIPANKPYITLIGDEDRANETVIVWQDKAGDKTADGSPLGTWNSASVTVLSDYFCASWITFENTVVVEPDSRTNVGDQAVALRVGGDHAMFYKARFLGSQDTLLDETGSHYFLQCFIQGTVDFIFGNARSLYKECHISVVAEGFAIAAQHRNSPTEDTGFSFVNCTVSGTGDVFLGRAWSDYARIVYIYTQFDLQVRPEGWSDWGNSSRRNTTVFGLYGCGGRGGDRNSSLDWSKHLNYAQAMPFLHTTFIGGDQWLRLYETNTTTTPRTTTPVSGTTGNPPVVTGRPNTTTTTPRTTTPVSGTTGNPPVVTGRPNITTTPRTTAPVSGTTGNPPVVTGRPNITTTPRTTAPVSGTTGNPPVVTGRPNITTTPRTTAPVSGTTGNPPVGTGRPNTNTTTPRTTAPVSGTTGNAPVVTGHPNTTTTPRTTTPVSGTAGNSPGVKGSPNTTTPVSGTTGNSPVSPNSSTTTTNTNTPGPTAPVRERSGERGPIPNSGGANNAPSGMKSSDAGIGVSNTILLSLILSLSLLLFWE